MEPLQNEKEYLINDKIYENNVHELIDKRDKDLQDIKENIIALGEIQNTIQESLVKQDNNLEIINNNIDNTLVEVKNTNENLYEIVESSKEPIKYMVVGTLIGAVVGLPLGIITGVSLISLPTAAIGGILGLKSQK